MLQLFRFYLARQIIREILRHEGCAGNIINSGSYFSDKDFILEFANTGSERKFFRGIEDKIPSEIVSVTDKSLIRRHVTEKLKQECFRKNQPYIHLAHYPKGYHTICTFRVDCDSTDRERFFNLVNHAGKHQLPLTWFLHVEAQESYLGEIAAIARDGHEVQLHCYHHETYNDYPANAQNLRKGKALMEAAGIPVDGFVAPYGKWNPSLNKVLEDMNFSYSSEFATGYQDFPFFPVFANRVSRILQLPVHPVCIGSLIKAGYSGREMMIYFDRVIRSAHQDQRPIMLYGHPQKEIDLFPQVIDFIFSQIRNLEKTWITTYSEYAKWWKKRLNAEFTLTIEQNTLTVSTTNTDPDLQLIAEFPGSKKAFIPLSTGRYDLNFWKESGKQTTL